MKKKFKIFALALPVLLFFLVVVWYLGHTNIPVLEPAGQIGQKERQLIIVTLLLAGIVVIPVYIMTIVIAWKYREGNKRAKYQPNWDHSRTYETLWWGIPLIIITILSVITWKSSHELDPFQPISSTTKPLTIQVVAMDWKWLFIYPDQHIASVNLAEFPENTPLNFEITSDTVMNSFWIPQLGGQIYAMPGMDTQLHLIADKTGQFQGSSANISGRGFADMTFTAASVPRANFNAWVETAAAVPTPLDQTSYGQLVRPSENVPVRYYSAATSSLFDDLMAKYVLPGGLPASTMSGMTMRGMAQ